MTKTALTWVLATAAAVLILAAAAAGGASMLWARATASMVADLRDGEASAPESGDVDGAPLPEPVARFLARSVGEGAGTIRFAQVLHEGTFQMGEGEGGWRPFRSTQLFRSHPPGFVWDARIRMAPVLDVRVRDGYAGGMAVMKGAVAALVSVVDASGTPELAQGSLFRYLAEAAWFPTRLLPGAGLEWLAEDDSTAWATLTDQGTRVTLRVRFSAEGDVTEVYAPDRLREEGDAYVPTPWVGRFHGHEVVDGFRIPMHGEVAWIVDGVEVPYWRGRVVEVRYQVAR